MHFGSPNSKKHQQSANNAKPSDAIHDPKSLADYLAVVWTISTLPAAMFVESVSNFFAGQKRRPFMDTINLSVMGHCYRESTLRQLRILTSTGALENELKSIVYSVAFTAHGLPNYNKDFQGEGFKARWISEIVDRKPEDPVILYLHGGGYALKACQPQISYICALARQLLPHRVSILALDYSISPFCKYPTQREEGVACYQELMKTCEKPILLGDSCGGHLALSILMEEDRVPPKSAYGLVLISPWVDPTAEDGSMNSKRDILSKRRLLEMAHNWLHPHDLEDLKTNPLKQDPSIWPRILPDNTCMVWGSDECLADQGAEWQKIAGVKDFFIERNGTHDCILRGIDPPPCKYVSNQLLKWVAGSDVAAGNPEHAVGRVHRSGSYLKSKFRRSSTSLTTPLGTPSGKRDSDALASRNVDVDTGSPRKSRPTRAVTVATIRETQVV